MMLRICLPVYPSQVPDRISSDNLPIACSSLRVTSLPPAYLSMTSGNYLTTMGRDPKEDIAMLQDMAMPVGVIESAI